MNIFNEYCLGDVRDRLLTIRLLEKQRTDTQSLVDVQMGALLKHSSKGFRTKHYMSSQLLRGQS